MDDNEFFLFVMFGCVLCLLIIIVVWKMFHNNKLEEGVIKKLGIDTKIGEIKSFNDNICARYGQLEREMEINVGVIRQMAAEIRTDHRSLETMLCIPQKRGPLGEMALETILSDQLPSSMFGIRKQVFGKYPDANIKSVAGIICIDSKFPLDNYKKMMDAEEKENKKMYKTAFMKDVDAHLQKIKDDYVRPDLGTAEFAFAYIPSEGVYYFLIEEMCDEMTLWAKSGVHVVSPLTISSKISIIKSGAHAKKLSEEAMFVLDLLMKLRAKFTVLDNDWKIFYSSHLTNAYKKAQAVDDDYRMLRDVFDKVEKNE